MNTWRNVRAFEISQLPFIELNAILRSGTALAAQGPFMLLESVNVLSVR